jgi:glycine betaine/proline transport system substrate-binding protein
MFHWHNSGFIASRQRLIILFTYFLLFTPIYSAGAQESSIVIPLNEWASQRVLSKVVGGLLQQNNVNVTYQEISVEKQWGALQRGFVHFQIEVWQPSMEKEFNRVLSLGAINDYGAHSAIVREDWWYPEYVEALCPGLPDWTALNDCAHLFSTNQSSKGVYYSGPWDYSDGQLIRALKLNFQINRFETPLELWEKLALASKQQKAVLLLNWTPNWTDNRIKGKFIKFPTYSPECKTKPEWGFNKALTMDCGNLIHSWLKKVAWTGLKDNYPCVSLMLENIDLTNAMIAEASALVIADGYSEEIAAEKWLSTYSKQAMSWFPKKCKISHHISTKNG